MNLVTFILIVFWRIEERVQQECALKILIKIDNWWTTTQKVSFLYYMRQCRMQEISDEKRGYNQWIFWRNDDDEFRYIYYYYYSIEKDI